MLGKAPDVARFTVERSSELPASEAWRRLTRWELHGDIIPCTTVTRSGAGAGSSFNARTSLGPLGFDDPMEVVAWQPPGTATAGRCRIEKRGNVINGWAELSVSPTPTGSRIRWDEEARIRRTGKVLELPSKWASKRIFGRLVDRLLTAE